MVACSKKNNTKILWYIVRTKPGQELALKDILERNITEEGNVVDFYCPIHTTHPEFYKYDDGRRDAPRVIKQKKSTSDKVKNTKKEYHPLFAGQVFVKGTEKAISDFLVKYFPTGHILYNAIISENGKYIPLVIPDAQFLLMKDFNESFKEDPLILNKSFDQYAFNHKTGKANDTVVILDGPLKGKIGYLVRMGKDRSKGFAFEMKKPYGEGTVTVGVSDIWNFHVARLHNADFDEASLATKKSRAFDLLVGLTQGAGFDDKEVLEVVYTIVDKLVKNNSFKNLCDYLIQTGKKLKKDPKQEGPYDKLSKSIKNLEDTDLSLILNLIRYETKFPGYVRDTFKSFIIRPFLTPSSGIKNVEGKDYAILKHKNFTEIIKEMNFDEKYFFPKTKNEKTINVHYYAHVGIKYTTKGYVFFTNWNDFLSKFYLIGGTARKWLISEDQIDKAIINPDSSLNNDTKKKWDSFYNYDKPLYKALIGKGAVLAVKDIPIGSKTLNVMAIRLFVPKKREIEDQLADDRVKYCIDTLINTCIEMCTEMSSETHMKSWRGYLNTVWLHK